MKTQNNAIKITGMIIGAVLIMFLLVYASINATIDRKTISSQGEATVTVMPDMVTINFLVETNGSTATEAKDKNSEIVDDVVDALIAIGFERKEIETTSYSVNEEYDWTDDGREFIGYKATHYIEVKFEAESQPELGPIVDAGVDAGALLQYMSFELSPELQSEYKAKALELAGSDAKLKAEAIASGVDAKLGKLISISSSNFGYNPWYAYDAKSLRLETASGAIVNDGDQTTSIQIGEREVSATITVIYQIN